MSAVDSRSKLIPWPSSFKKIFFKMRFLFLFFSVIIAAQRAGPAERLKKKLFETNNYNSNIRPQKNHTEPVLVKFRPILNEIINVNEVAQKIDIKFWFHHEWVDERLSWDPKDYGNVATLHVPQDYLWLPDYALYGRKSNGLKNENSSEKYFFY